MSYKTNPISNRLNISAGWRFNYTPNKLNWSYDVSNNLKLYLGIKQILLKKKFCLINFQRVATNFYAEPYSRRAVKFNAFFYPRKLRFKYVKVVKSKRIGLKRFQFYKKISLKFKNGYVAQLMLVQVGCSPFRVTYCFRKIK